VYVTYFDEVKAIPANGQNIYFVGGICVPMKNIAEFEKKINAMAQDLFGSIDLTRTPLFTRGWFTSRGAHLKRWISPRG
jgi:hypothetical protein